MSRVEAEVRRCLSDVTRPGLVAVSGGADSVALLCTMKTVCPVPLTVVHVNYKLRGVESDGDEAFVSDLAMTFHLPFLAKTLAIPNGEPIESTARELRYDWFLEVAQKRNCGWIATGHTADDQAETVLHRMMRGTGIAGLVGIQQQRAVENDPSITILRPLLNFRRNELRDYLNELQQPYRNDSSNADPRFTRNRIRHELIPLLKTFNPQIVDSLVRLSEQAGEMSSLVEEQLLIVANTVVLPAAGETQIFDAEKLAAINPFLVRSFFRHFWETQGWPLGDMTAEHWQRLVTLNSNDYPGGISVRRVGKVVQLRRKS